jgi:hypothetical protein
MSRCGVLNPSCASLLRAGWCWKECGTGVELLEHDETATKCTDDGGYTLLTGGLPMTQGRHYWEIVINLPLPSAQVPSLPTIALVGAVRPGLDHSTSHCQSNDVYYIGSAFGALCGNGKRNADKQGKFANGDCIGVLLDLDAGRLCFYRNGKQCGPGFTEGVTGPLVRAAALANKGTVTVVPGAMAPAIEEGAGSMAGRPALGQ